MKITACMIAKNEEKVIARCIESYRAAVDEVIVVDTGSTDQTVAIAKSLGAKVFHFTWIDDFAAAKNYAISKAKGDWIIFLDADEYFAEGTEKNIRAYLHSLAPEFNSVACKMINIDQITGQVLDEITHVRIFKNSKHIRYVNPIHEMLQNTGGNKKMNACLADSWEIRIYHTGYSDDNRQEKAKRNLELLLRELPQAEKNPAYYHYIADCYFGLEEWEKVIEYTKLFFASGVKFVGYNVRPHNNLIDAMMVLKYPSNEVMKEIDIAIEKFPQHPIFHFYKGNLLYTLKQYDAAFEKNQETLLLHKNYQDIEINSLSVNLWAVYNTLGAINEYRNDCEAAIEYYLETLRVDKYNAAGFDRLVKLIRSQPLQDIVSFLNTLYDVENEADLDFLATSLVNHAVPQVLAYYTNLREKKYPKQDYVVLQMLVANGYYDKAFAALLDCYGRDRDERLALVAATAAILSGKSFYIAQAVEQLPSAYMKILKAYNGKIMLFAEEDKTALLNLVRTFIFWADDSGLEKLVGLANQFPGGMAAELGSLFVKEGYYQIGLNFYNYAVQQAVGAGTPVQSGLYYNQGYCLHRLNNPVAAAEAFIKAYDAGYRGNDIYEFLRWNVDKLGDGSVKDRAEEILRDEVEKGELAHFKLEKPPRL